MIENVDDKTIKYFTSIRTTLEYYDDAAESRKWFRAFVKEHNGKLYCRKNSTTRSLMLEKKRSRTCAFWSEKETMPKHRKCKRSRQRRFPTAGQLKFLRSRGVYMSIYSWAYARDLIAKIKWKEKSQEFLDEDHNDRVRRIHFSLTTGELKWATKSKRNTNR